MSGAKLEGESDKQEAFRLSRIPRIPVPHPPHSAAFPRVRVLPVSVCPARSPLELLVDEIAADQNDLAGIGVECQAVLSRAH